MDQFIEVLRDGQPVICIVLTGYADSGKAATVVAFHGKALIASAFVYPFTLFDAFCDDASR